MAALESRLESLEASVRDGAEDIKENAKSQLNYLPPDQYEQMLFTKSQNFEHAINSFVHQIQHEFSGLAPDKHDPYYPQKLESYERFNSNATKALSSLQGTANRYFSKLNDGVRTICGWVRQNKPTSQTLIGIGQIFAQLAGIIVPLGLGCCIS